MKEIYCNLLDKVHQLEGLLIEAVTKKNIKEDTDSKISALINELNTLSKTRAKNKAGNDEIPYFNPSKKFKEKKESESAFSAFYALEDDDDEVTAKDNSDVIEKPNVEENRVLKRRKPVFSLNDRFLFARELFGGDMKRFDRTVDALSEKKSYQEAEEYLKHDVHLNPEDPTSASFLELIRRYF